MKFEDFVSDESLLSGSRMRALPRKHVFAMGATALTAAALFFVLPDAAQLKSTEIEKNAPAPVAPRGGELTLAADGTVIDSPDPAANTENQTLTAQAAAPAQQAEPESLTADKTSSAPAANTDAEEVLTAAADIQAAPEEASAEEAAPKKSSLLAEFIDPKAKLTDTIAGIAKTLQDKPAPAETAAENEALDNYEDGLPDALLADSDSPLEDELQALSQAASGKTEVQAKWFVEDIQRGDTISSLFSDFNIPWEVMTAITKHKEAGNSLTNLRPGNHLSFLVDEENNLLAFVKQTSADEQIRFYRKDASTLDFTVVREGLNSHLLDDSTAKSEKAQLLAAQAQQAENSTEVPAYKKRGRLVLVTIGKGQAFSTAAHQSGLTYAEIEQITKLFKGRIQFSRHIQPGDTMRVLFSEEKGEGKINAVEFKLARHGTLTTFRNLADDEYYDENGYNISTAVFRRFPLDGKFRISSGFNPHRRHPVTGKVRPHKGTDFAVPVGTPIVAPADGIVDKATYSRSAGYYIVLRHAGGYSTVYMHCSKLNVKAGQRVKIGSVIARSGNTGISTGPHLHYELRINNRPVNAMRVNLPKNGEATIAAKQRKRFENNVELYKKELHEDSLIAAAD